MAKSAQAKSEILEAGDFTLAEARLLTSSGLDIDVKENIMQINFYEDILKNSITGEILVQDAGGFVSIGPIMGQEYLRLKIFTASITEDVAIIDFTKNVLLINSVENRTEVGNDISAYVLSFTTSEIVKNQRTRVNKALSGSYSDIVEEMLKVVDCQKKVFLEPTKGVKRIIAPNIPPFSVIDLAAKYATSQSTEKLLPNYLFYENFLGYNFRSLSSLYTQPVVQQYKTFIAGTQQPSVGIVGKNTNTNSSGALDHSMERQYQMIIGHEMVDGNDTLFNHTTGVYASKHIVHDIVTKSFKTKFYNYFDNFGNEKHIGKNPIFSETSIDKNGKRVSDFPTRTFLTSKSTFGLNDAQHVSGPYTYPFSIDPENSLQERTSTLNQLNRGIIINLAVVGGTHVKAGDIVDVEIPLTAAFAPPDSEDAGNDRFYSGKFLVKNLYHSFDFGEKKHKMILTCVKDSLEKPLQCVDGQTEPKPNKSLNVVPVSALDGVNYEY